MKSDYSNTTGHIGKKTWKRLSHRQREVIKRDRVNAAKHVASFLRDKKIHLGLSKKDLTF